MDIDKLLKALDNEKNESLFNFTTDKLREMNSSSTSSGTDSLAKKAKTKKTT